MHPAETLRKTIPLIMRVVAIQTNPLNTQEALPILLTMPLNILTMAAIPLRTRFSMPRLPPPPPQHNISPTRPLTFHPIPNTSMLEAIQTLAICHQGVSLSILEVYPSPSPLNIPRLLLCLNTPCLRYRLLPNISQKPLSPPHSML